MLSRTDLDTIPCQCCGVPGHGPMYVHGRCHPTARVMLTYKDGVATCNCGRCGKVIAEIATLEPNFKTPTRPTSIHYRDGELHLEHVGRVVVCEIN